MNRSFTCCLTDESRPLIHAVQAECINYFMLLQSKVVVGSTFPDANYDASYNTHLLTVSNSEFPYPQANTKSSATKGMVTGSKVKILGESTYLYTMSIYDDKGRVI